MRNKVTITRNLLSIKSEYGNPFLPQSKNKKYCEIKLNWDKVKNNNHIVIYFLQSQKNESQLWVIKLPYNDVTLWEIKLK